MLRKKVDEVQKQQVTMEGVEGTHIQWLLGPEDAVPSFFMRRFTMARGGTIPLHGHPWEHEIYFLSGRAEVFTESETVSVEPGDTLYVPPDELHGYRNGEDEELEFLCIVPRSAVG